jgi:hypothetical protein
LEDRVGGEGPLGLQAVSGQPGGAGVLAPQPDPRVVPLALFPPLDGPVGISIHYRPHDQGPQLPPGLACPLAGDQLLGLAGVLIGQDAGLAGDHPHFRQVQDTLVEGGAGQRQPHLQYPCQLDQVTGGIAGDRELAGEFLIQVLAPQLRQPARSPGFVPGSGTAADDLPDRGQLL